MRYTVYVEGREPLLSMANFCLSYVESEYAAQENRRKSAAPALGVDFDILTKVGNLTANRGGRDTARTVGGGRTFEPLTPA